MQEAVEALVNGDRVVGTDAWRALWDDLARGTLAPGETVALLASLATRTPDRTTVRSFVAALRERSPRPEARFHGAVNLGGTGGGPPTMNISTAAGFVAAELGVKVAKTGSGGYSGRCGSLELLELLGVPLARSYDATGEMLDRFGVAFAREFVYPAELSLLARSVRPLDLRRLGRFVNLVGPFLAVLPVTAQVVGVSAAAPLPQLRHLADACDDRDVWLCTNDLGVDELVSFTTNTIIRNRGGGTVVCAARPPGPGETHGALADLAPAGRASTIARHFMDVLGGTGPGPAANTVCLNAAAAVVASGATDDWDAAVRSARDVVDSGAAVRLVERMRSSHRRHPRPARVGR